MGNDDFCFSKHMSTTKKQIAKYSIDNGQNKVYSKGIRHRIYFNYRRREAALWQHTT